MPSRIIRDAILTSEAVASLGWPEEVFYRRLHSIVDDYGRYEANPQLLRSRCYPLQTDNVRTADITRWMAACQKAGLILGYEVAGKQYLEVLKFGQQQRTASKYPAPPPVDNNREQLTSNEHLDVSVFGVVSVSEGVAPAAPDLPTGKKKKTGLPPDFAVSERVKAWAAERGYILLDKHLESFVSKCKAKGYTYVDWDEGFMGAIRDDWAKLRTGNAAIQSVTVPSKPGIDPALAKIVQDSLKAAPPSAEVREQMRKLTGAKA